MKSGEGRNQSQTGLSLGNGLNKHPGRDGSSLQSGLSSGGPARRRGTKFKIPLPRTFLPRPTEYACQVSSTFAQRSRSLRVLTMLTLHEGTDGWTDIYDWLYKSSQGRRLTMWSRSITACDSYLVASERISVGRLEPSHF